jgi:hypothetical protein
MKKEKKDPAGDTARERYLKAKQLAQEAFLEWVDADEVPPLSTTNQIGVFMHCGLCGEELKAGKAPGESPRSYSRYSVGSTRRGLQVWCNRHNCNVCNIDFEGAKHPANLTRGDVT